MERISTVLYFIVIEVKNFIGFRVKSIRFFGSALAEPLENSVCKPDKALWQKLLWFKPLCCKRLGFESSRSFEPLLVFEPLHLIRLVNRFMMNLSNDKPLIDTCSGKSIHNRSIHPRRKTFFTASHGKTVPDCGLSKRSSGFTLIEIAIVLVVVTLILAGVLKGQSLIDSARVRSMATDVTGIRAAWYSFQDRYRSLPGDFPNARTQIDDATVPGNGNGRIDDSRERAGVWQQMALAGFIKGSFDGLESSAGTAQDMNCSASTCPRNPYNGFYKISYGSQAENAAGPAHEIFTGDSIPVNILAELDSKLDDGKADAGRFRVHRDFSGSCSVDGEWNVSAGHANCAGVLRD